MYVYHMIALFALKHNGNLCCDFISQLHTHKVLMDESGRIHSIGHGNRFLIAIYIVYLREMLV